MKIWIIDWGCVGDRLKPYTHGQEIEVPDAELNDTVFRIARELWDKRLNVMLSRRPHGKGIKIAVDTMNFTQR